MRPRRPLPTILLLLLFLAGCDNSGSLPGDPTPPQGDDDDATDDDDAVANPTELDFGITGPATLGDPFTAQIRVPGFGGAVTFFQTGGDLPAGLRVTANGVIHGTPDEGGTFAFTVTATEMTIPDIVDDATLTVLIPDVPLHLGVAHDRPTILTEERDLQRQPWMRIQADGDRAMTEITLQLGLYHPGPDGEDDGGWDDDLLMETVPVAECTVTPGTWVLPDDTDCNPADDPPHCVEDDLMTYEGGGRFVTGADTGHYEVHIDCGERGVLDTRVLAVPPGWCPLGHHYGGPQWQGPGACEPE